MIRSLSLNALPLCALGLSWCAAEVQAAEPLTDGPTPQPKAGKLELNVFPIVGGDSDVGIGGGQVSNLARLGATPGSFLWKIEDATFVTFKLRDGGLIIPFIDLFARLTVPRFGPSGRFRIEVRPSYTDERTLGYYGIGNASRYPEEIRDDDLEYRRTHPTLAAKLRVRIVGPWHASVGGNFTWSRLQIPPGTLLARERAEGSPVVRRLLGDFDSHGTQLFSIGLEYDSRDQETDPTRGQYHSLRVRGGPSLGPRLPYRFLHLEAIARVYTTPIPRWLSVSLRVVADAFVGDPPFYELARYADTPAIGGGKAVRGIPAQRYHGKVKLFGNLEARSDLLPFKVRGKPFVLGAAAFLDAGRTWTELLRAHPDLDGRGVGLKYGVGGGLRLQQGTTFIVRTDVAWSPDARPVGAYFDAGHIF